MEQNMAKIYILHLVKKNMGQLLEKEGEKDTKYQSLGSLWLPSLQ